MQVRRPICSWGGSGRFSPRNQFVASSLQAAGIGTLLMDLLEENEEDDREKVFDIELLAGRLQSAADWLLGQAATQSCRLGYFGASTGAAAALVTAARNPENVSAVISRGGRPAQRQSANAVDRWRLR